MEQINTDKNKYSSDYFKIIYSRKYIDANNEINDEIDNMISHLNRNDYYMTLRVPTSKVVNSILKPGLKRKLPSNITIKGSISPVDISDNEQYQNTICSNIVCYIKNIDQPLHSRYHCKCYHNSECHVDTSDMRWDAPAWDYNGKHLINCICDDNIVMKLLNDSEYIYKLNNIDIIIISVDDYGSYNGWHIVIVDNKIDITVGDGFYGI